MASKMAFEAHQKLILITGQAMSSLDQILQGHFYNNDENTWLYRAH